MMVMVNTATKKGVTQPQNGFIDGVIQVTTEGTTYSMNVSTVTGYSNVTSIVNAVVSLNVGATIASTIAQDVPICSWTTTDCVIKITCDASQSTNTISVRFVGM
jgi:hypothetical protein